ncbi:MAG: hypothetical protein V5A14_02965 [Desulfohalobiaceae bacterium]
MTVRDIRIMSGAHEKEEETCRNDHYGNKYQGDAFVQNMYWNALLYIFLLILPLTLLQVKTATANVVVLIPFAQEPGDSPTNIKNIIKESVVVLKAKISIVLAPALRHVTD